MSDAGDRAESGDGLRALAEAAGIAPRWRDVHGQEQEVAPGAMRAVLAALGLPAGSAAQVAEARAELRARAGRLPPLLTLTCGSDGGAVPGAYPGARYLLVFEGGGSVEGHLERGWGGEARLPPLSRPGYHQLTLDAGEAVVAAAPPRCFTLEEAGAARHAGGLPWAVAAQIYALRQQGDLGIGDFGGVAALAQAAARHGAAAVAVSPAHALFAADPGKYGPYAPSSRLFLNVLYADPQAALGPLPAEAPGADPDLVDYPAATARKTARLRRLFAAQAGHPGFAAWRAAAGPALEAHARFEALHAHHVAQGRWHWREWPAEHRTPEAPGIAAFARDHAEEVAFHAFGQWLADASRGAAQAAARAAGMPVGLIADLAVGTDGGGSQAWARQAELLPGVSVGAPPDIFSPKGQDWGLTAFSPLEMRAGGFGAFLELLRAVFRGAGGVRVDHAMGLQRLWVVPQGEDASGGAYLHYPVDDLLRLLALESHRHRAIVIGEDLGTVPEGFNERVARAGILGMRVLWFEGAEGRFKPPAAWTRDAAAMTTTHDLPTVVGWWRGNDVAWRERLELFPTPEAAEAEWAARARDRAGLWAAMRESGAASGEPPGPEDAARVLEPALVHTGSAACHLAILPAEDALGLAEQPNLPGTVSGHPNWQRRLPGEAATLLDAPEVAARLAAFTAARRRATS